MNLVPLSCQCFATGLGTCRLLQVSDNAGSTAIPRSVLSAILPPHLSSLPEAFNMHTTSLVKKRMSMPSTLQNSWMAESRYQDILLDKLPDCISRNLFKRGGGWNGACASPVSTACLCSWWTSSATSEMHGHSWSVVSGWSRVEPQSS